MGRCLLFIWLGTMALLSVWAIGDIAEIIFLDHPIDGSCEILSNE